MKQYTWHLILLLNLLLQINTVYTSPAITPCKYDPDAPCTNAPYTIPNSARYTINRPDVSEPQLVYYLSCPQTDTYPIAILCGGSSSRDNIESIIHFHRYFLQEFMDLDVAVLTVEQWGIDGNHIDKNEFMYHYTRSQRLNDHVALIEYLQLNPPVGWDGTLIFLGVSEGGPLVTTLSATYPQITAATINFSGAGDWPWHEELWLFLQALIAQNPTCSHQLGLQDCHICSQGCSSRKRYDSLINTIIHNPSPDEYFLNMTYKYLADAFQHPRPDYQNLSAPFLVVTGAQDAIIASSDAFIQNAKNVGVNTTYLRIETMDHYVRKRPDVIQKSFEWLAQQLQKKPSKNKKASL